LFVFSWGCFFFIFTYSFLNSLSLLNINYILKKIPLYSSYITENTLTLVGTNSLPPTLSNGELQLHGFLGHTMSHRKLGLIW
jgi:hypothetical protein